MGSSTGVNKHAFYCPSFHHAVPLLPTPTLILVIFTGKPAGERLSEFTCWVKSLDTDSPDPACAAAACKEGKPCSEWWSMAGRVVFNHDAISHIQLSFFPPRSDKKSVYHGRRYVVGGEHKTYSPRAIAPVSTVLLLLLLGLKES